MHTVSQTIKANQRRLAQLRHQRSVIRKYGLTAGERSSNGNITVTTAQMLTTNRTIIQSFLNANRLLRAAERGEIAA